MRPPLSGHTAVYALLGSPVAHSLSPALHNAAFAAHDIDAIYVCLEVDPGHPGDLASAIRQLGLAGVNLTVPLKERVLDQLDEVEPLARVLGAVNTVVRRGAQLHGYNTDAGGFVDGLHRAFGEVSEGAHVVILGAGGAGVACGAGLAEAGARRVTWLNRSLPRAEAAARRCAPAWPGCDFRAAPWDDFARVVVSADVVVQATSGGGARAVEALDPDLVPARAVWSDLNYWMAEPPLRAPLEARGVRFQDGRAMLAHQAARAFRHFTGISPDLDVMMQVIC